MSRSFRVAVKQATLAQRFMLASLMILIVSMAGIGLWIGNEIKNGVIHRTGATTALYVDSFVAPLLQELGTTGALSPEHQEKLSNLMQDTPLGQQIVTFRVWDPTGKVIFSTDETAVGKTFPIEGGLANAIWGQVSSEISQLEAEENVAQRAIRSELLETYSPVRLSGTNQVIAVAEFYQTVDVLNQEIAAAQRRSWLVVGAVTLFIYLLLAGFVQRSSNTIEQQATLNDQIARLTELLAQNRELHERVRRAAGSVTTLNERFLRRIGSELHDGPAQDLGLVLLKLDALIGRSEQAQAADAFVEDLTSIEASLQSAHKEIRAISSGLSLPQLAELSLPETVIRAVRAHERRTGSRVMLDMAPLPEQATLPVKITVYRVLQESLNNAFRHAGGANQQIRAFMDGDLLALEISDEGPGFVRQPTMTLNGHLGLTGMRERVESLGGRFSVKSEPGKGTQVAARLPWRAEDGDNER